MSGMGAWATKRCDKHSVGYPSQKLGGVFLRSLRTGSFDDGLGNSE